MTTETAGTIAQELQERKANLEGLLPQAPPAIVPDIKSAIDRTATTDPQQVTTQELVDIYNTEQALTAAVQQQTQPQK